MERHLVVRTAWQGGGGVMAEVVGVAEVEGNGPGGAGVMALVRWGAMGKGEELYRRWGSCRLGGGQ